jgi:iron(II)-dependent oxidoreductase
MPLQAAVDLHDPLLTRSGGADALSLAAMDARNRTLAWLAVFDAAPADTQRAVLYLTQQALQCGALIDVAVARERLAETMEHAQDAIAACREGGAGDPRLHPWRAALHREDRLVERYAALAHARGLQAAAALVPPPLALAPREPLWFAAQRLPAPAPGWRPDNERDDAADESEPLPEFEIDAHAVTWQQYVEFMADGGYDEPRWWSDAGWAWVEAQGRRAPRDVEQWRHGVLVTAFGRPVRASAAAPAVGVTKYEAEAWCRWAGRRLPTGVEWQLAATLGASRGVVAHQVSEWVLGRAPDGSAVQRGVPWFAPRRLAHPALRSAVGADRDDGFAGFRSCAL